VSQGADIEAAAAVLNILAQIDFAAVAAIAVAIFKSRLTLSDNASFVVANRVGVCQLAVVAAFPAIEGVAVQGCFATVLGAVIAVREIALA
jgi:hypothetical protein